MSIDLSILLFDSNAFTDDAQNRLVAVADIAAPRATCGSNGLFIPNGSMQWRGLTSASAARQAMDAAPFDFQVFNAEQRRRTRFSRRAVADRVCASVDASRNTSIGTFVATLAVVHEAGLTRVYHYAHEGDAGALFLHLIDLPALSRGGSVPDERWNSWLHISRHALTQAATLRHMLSDDCWYTKWRPEMELERKFTSRQIPDMWQLATDLHASMGAGAFEGFILELDRDFQSYDYESHIFEVSGQYQSESGYIAFIPQADGLMAVKRKWFVQNDELRREDFSTNHRIAIDAIEPYARAMTAAPIHRMKPFRRTRFDVNCESLANGNGFGIYFDICRMVDGSASFAQIEVEYCRSRTLRPLHDIEGDFERIASLVHAFLLARGLAFTHDLYSKLDFVREASLSTALT